MTPRIQVGLGTDERFMRVALREAAHGAGHVSPNPLVGAVAVKDERVIGRAHHAAYGEAHAEIVLISKLRSDEIRGSTIYVNLEPCCHVGKTAPCTDSIIAARPRRVVVGHEDPNPLIAGRGIAVLRAAGIQVTVGILEREARTLNAPFLTYITKGRPWLLLKVGQSLDGRIALASGESRWITSEPARAEVHRLRATLDAVIVGSQTVLDDDPELTVRQVKGRSPLRVVFDSRLRISPSARVFSQEHPERTWVFTAEAELAKRAAEFERTGATMFAVPTNHLGRIELSHAMNMLGEHGVTSALVEGGGTLHAALMREGLVDKFIAAIAPFVIGGDGRPSIGEMGMKSLGEVRRMNLTGYRQVGDDIWLEFE